MQFRTPTVEEIEQLRRLSDLYNRQPSDLHERLGLPEHLDRTCKRPCNLQAGAARLAEPDRKHPEADEPGGFSLGHGEGETTVDGHPLRSEEHTSELQSHV